MHGNRSLTRWLRGGVVSKSPFLPAHICWRLVHHQWHPSCILYTATKQGQHGELRVKQGKDSAPMCTRGCRDYYLTCRSPARGMVHFGCARNEVGFPER
jgi:hypothetical protein